MKLIYSGNRLIIHKKVMSKLYHKPGTGFSFFTVLIIFVSSIIYPTFISVTHYYFDPLLSLSASSMTVPASYKASTFVVIGD